MPAFREGRFYLKNKAENEVGEFAAHGQQTVVKRLGKNIFPKGKKVSVLLGVLLVSQ